MALAPTLLKFLNQSIGVSAVTLAGLAVTAETGQRGPSVGAASIAGNAPSIVVVVGPTAAPDSGYIEMGGLQPFLLRTLVIAPGLPDATPEENDLAPTLVWQETAQPAQAPLTLSGQQPVVVSQGGSTFIAAGLGSAVINPLAPTLDLPAGQTGTSAPTLGAAAFTTATEPTLLAELAVGIAANQDEGTVLSIVGLAPDLSFQVGWEDVPVAETPSWTDVPRV
ncbi:hypothetical protein [Nitrospira sp. BLG_2]|uniref:hypothetical protein n=1 Tax=Nitrospira sp. BLG_2 TaxID=3397507 RepID=UPI003B9D1234